MRHITAKIIRHRHDMPHIINGHTKEVREETEFKILFSWPAEMAAWKKWVEDRGGEYKYNKDISKQEGKIPDVKDIFDDEDFCWCDTMTYYLQNVAGFQFHSALSPYTGEIYTKTVRQ